MASKKDKLNQAARREVEKNIGSRPPASMSEIVDALESDRVKPPGPESGPGASPPEDILIPRRRQSSENGPEGPLPSMQRPRRPEIQKMAKSRDSIYNVSSDIRLEDYTEASSAGGGGGFGNIGRIVGGIVLVAILGAGIYSLFTWIFGPDYILAVASEEISEENIEDIAKRDDVEISTGSAVHIRFQWDEGDLKTNYLKIKIENTSKNEEEEASMSRKTPASANYIYYVYSPGPMEPGKYTVKVMDREEDVLEEKEFQVQ